MHLSMLSPTIPHPGYTRAKWGFDNIKYEIPTPLGTPCCQMPLLRLLMLWDLTILHVKTLPLGQLVGIKSPCIAPLYPRWGIVGLNIDRCIIGCHTAAQRPSSLSCQKPALCKVRVVFSKPVYAVRAWDCPPGTNHGLFKAKPSSHHVHSILPVTPPISPCPTLSADAEPARKRAETIFSAQCAV